MDHNQKYENYKRKSLTQEGKYTVKVTGQPIIYLGGKLKDKSTKFMYVHNKQLKDTQNQKNVKYIKNMWVKGIKMQGFQTVFELKISSA